MQVRTATPVPGPARPHGAFRFVPRRLLLALALAAAVGAVAACGDDPFNPDWVPLPDTVRLYALSRPELNLPSAYNLAERVPVRVESASATGNWDFALDRVEGQMVLLPPGALGINSRARLTGLDDIAFDDVREAPTDSAAYVTETALPLEAGVVYVFRSGRRPGSFGRSCVFYAKAELLAVDMEAETATLNVLVNPLCNDPRLVPPATD